MELHPFRQFGTDEGHHFGWLVFARRAFVSFLVFCRRSFALFCRTFAFVLFRRALAFVFRSSFLSLLMELPGRGFVCPIDHGRLERHRV